MRNSVSPLFQLAILCIALFLFSCAEEKDEDEVQPVSPQINTPQSSLDTSSFIDSRDGVRYKTVKIGTQNWMAEDLKYLPEVFPPDSGSMTTARYYVHSYEGDSVLEAKATENFQTYGVLYNWFAAMNGTPAGQSPNIKGICPDGWHLPSDEEWTTLTDFLGKRPVAGGKLKERGTAHWQAPNAFATNESGFTALPAGNRTNNGEFEFLGINCIWWSATSVSIENAYIRNVYYAYGDVYRIDFLKEYGFCVRCIQDDTSREGG